MSELKDYIDYELENEYIKISDLSKSSLNTIELYKHNLSLNLIVAITSHNRNDCVFRMLRGIDSLGYLPKIYEVSSEDTYLFVLEEYVTGTYLSDIISDRRPIDNAYAKSILLDLCNSLEILHSLGIVHRDIKPENIIIRPSGHACLMDLSIARVISDKYNDTFNLGTAGFAAPEQYGITQSLPTSDIYQLGVLANYLTVGVHPTLNIPNGRMGRIIKKCTSTQISDRYQNIQQVKKALRHI